MIKNQRWIYTGEQIPVGKCPVFYKNFSAGEVVKATLSITQKGCIKRF